MEFTAHQIAEYLNGEVVGNPDVVVNVLSKIEEVALKQFKIVYKEGEIRKGKNLLAFEVAKRNIYNFLMSEKKAIQNNDAIKVMCLEAPLEVIIEHEDLPCPIKIAGKVDRIEERNGSIRIIDYKSGKVEQRHLRINDFDGLTTSLKNEKVIQLLCYAMMFQNSEMFQNQDIQAGIISFKVLLLFRHLSTASIINGANPRDTLLLLEDPVYISCLYDSLSKCTLLFMIFYVGYPRYNLRSVFFNGVRCHIPIRHP